VIDRLLAGVGPERLDTVLVTAGGAEIYVEGVVSKRSDAGRPLILGIFRDVRERKLIERMKDEFISTVSHELRTPLTSMLGSLGLVRSQRLADQPERVADLLQIAQRNGERLLRLINDLLDLQKLSAGELRLDLTAVDVDSLIDETLVGIRGMADLTRVSLRRLGRATGARVSTDRDRLGQVLYNLLSNAIKFSPPGEAVSVWTTAANGEVTISVVDNGPGIPEEFKARLFEKFAQASPGGQSAGTGLGLAISKRLVEKLGGTIAIHSSEGSGTTVSLSLPLAPAR
jgi:signal transduction histidine kinase